MARSLRCERGLTQRALAERCGLSQSTISRLENGLAPGVRVIWLARLLVSLEPPIDGRAGRPWWSVPEPPRWRVALERFRANGPFFRRLREESARGDFERQARLMHLQASLRRRLYGGELEPSGEPATGGELATGGEQGMSLTDGASAGEEAG